MRRTPRGGSGTGHGQIAQAELLKLQKSGQFPDEPVRIKGAQIHYVDSVTPRRTRTDSSHTGDSVRGTIIIVSVILSYFVSGNLI